MATKIVKEIVTDVGGNVSVEYSDDSTAKFNIADTVTAVTNPLTGGIELTAGTLTLNHKSKSFTQKYALPVIERFNAIVDWTVTKSGQANALASEGGLFSKNCIAVTSPSGGGSVATVMQNQTFDMSNQNGFWLLLDTKYRKPSAGLGFAAQFSQSLGMASGVGRWQVSAPVAQGSVSRQSYWSSKASMAVMDGAPNFANPILSWQFRHDTNAEQTDFALLGVMLGGQRPTVIFSFDDGWDSSYTIGHAEARKREIPLTHYLIHNLIGRNDIGYITASQAIEMADRGDYLGLHGDSRWDTDTQKVASDYVGLKATFGNVSEFEHAAYPEGKIGVEYAWKDTVGALQQKGVKSARLTGTAISSPNLLGYTDPMVLIGTPLNNTITLAQAQAAVDTAIASGGTVIFYGHKIGGAADALTWVTSDYTTLLDYIVTKRNAGAIEVKTIKQWYDQTTEI